MSNYIGQRVILEPICQICQSAVAFENPESLHSSMSCHYAPPRECEYPLNGGWVWAGVVNGMLSARRNGPISAHSSNSAHQPISECYVWSKDTQWFTKQRASCRFFSGTKEQYPQLIALCFVTKNAELVEMCHSTHTLSSAGPFHRPSWCKY